MVGNRANLSEIWTAPCTQCAFIVLPSQCSSESGRDKITQLIVWHCSIALFSSFKLLHSCWEDNHSWKFFYWQKAPLTPRLRIKVIDAQCKTKTNWGTYPSMTKHPPSGDQYSSEMSIPKIVDTVGYKLQLHFPLNHSKNFRLLEGTNFYLPFLVVVEGWRLPLPFCIFPLRQRAAWVPEISSVANN